jgi:hypothetical protein
MSLLNMLVRGFAGHSAGTSGRVNPCDPGLTCTSLLPTALAWKRMVGSLVSLMGTLATWAQIEFLPATAPQAIFGGQPSTIGVTLCNRGAETAQSEFSTRLLQVSSATVMPVSQPQPWKRIQVLAGQTLVESVPVRLPEVRTKMLFRLAILAGGKPIAHYPVVACPPDLLKQMASLGGAKRVGIFDPEGKLRPALDHAGAPFVALEINEDRASEECALAIFGPFASRDKVPAELAARATELAKRNVAVIALLPSGALSGVDQSGISECVTVLRGGSRGSVIVCEGGAKEFDGSAGAQLALFRMAELALGLQPLPWESVTRP